MAAEIDPSPDYYIATPHGLLRKRHLIIEQEPRWGRVIKLNSYDCADVAEYLTWAADYIEEAEADNGDDETADGVAILRTYAAEIADAGMEAAFTWSEKSAADAKRRGRLQL